MTRMATHWIQRSLGLLVVLGAACGGGGRHGATVPSVTLPATSATEAAAVAPRRDDDPRFFLAGNTIVDALTLHTSNVPENTLQRTLARDQLVYAVGDRIVARDLAVQKDLWSSPVPNRVGMPQIIVANDDRVFVIGNPDGIAGYALASGQLVAERDVPKTGGSFAANGAVAHPDGIAFLVGDDGAVFVSNAGTTTGLAAPAAPKGATGSVVATKLVMTERGPCVSYHANEHWQALRCFDLAGRVAWERPFAEGRLWLVEGSKRHVLLSTQGHYDDREPQTIVLAAANGARELELPHASGALLEDAAHELRGVLAWNADGVALFGPGGAEVWRLPYPRRGLVTAVQIRDDVVFVAHPMSTTSADTTLEVVRASAVGKEIWRTQVTLPNAPRLGPNAIRLAVARDRLVIVTLGRTTMLDVLDLADGKMALAVP